MQPSAPGTPHPISSLARPKLWAILVVVAAWLGVACASPVDEQGEYQRAGSALATAAYSEDFTTAPYAVVTTGDCGVVSTAGASGPGMRCNDTATVEFDVDVSGFTQLTLSYALQTRYYDAGETFSTQVSVDGQNWETVDQVAAAPSYIARSLSLDATYEGGLLFVRFASNANGYLERFDLDDLRVDGEATCDPNDPQCQPTGPACNGPFVDSAAAHVAAGRATSTRESCGWFCRRTVYRALGSGEELAATGGVKLFEEEAGYYTQQNCGATQHTLVPQSERLAIPLGEPFTGATSSQWRWYEVPGVQCRDGSPAGLSIRLGSSDNVMIYLEGGGACYTQQECAINPASLGETFGQFPPREDGIFNNSDSDNPVRTWNMVYIPYCSGDVFMGNKRDVVVPGVPGQQQFVGYANMRILLSRLAATFYRADQVLLTGRSAGGFGSMANFHQAQQAFDGIGTVHVVDDSGPPFGAPYLADCLLARFQALWDLYGALPNGFDGNLGEAMALFASWYPNNTGGVITSLEDESIRVSWSYGLNACADLDGTPPAYPGSLYAAGVYDMQSNYMPSSLGTYLIPGSVHTWTGSSSFYYNQTNGFAPTIAQWVGAVLGGSAPRVGP